MSKNNPHNATAGNLNRNNTPCSSCHYYQEEEVPNNSIKTKIGKAMSGKKFICTMFDVQLDTFIDNNTKSCPDVLTCEEHKPEN